MAEMNAANMDDEAEPAVDPCVRVALTMAMHSGDRVVLYLRGDATRGVPVRLVEGRPASIVCPGDGRERVILVVAEGETEQIVLLERIARVATPRT